MNKTIKQLADELGCSKTAIRKKMDSFPDFRENHTETTANGVITISPEGCKLIAETLQITANQSPQTAEITIPLEVWRTLQAQLEEKTQQLESKDLQLFGLQKQNEALTKALENTTSSLKASQALHAGTIQKQLQELPAEQKKKFGFGWLKKKKTTVQENGQSEK